MCWWVAESHLLGWPVRCGDLCFVGVVRFGWSYPVRSAGRAVRFSCCGLGAVAAAGAAAAVWNRSTLASRRAIWDFVWDRIVERPFIGQGWFTVWDLGDFNGADELWSAGSAHNSFLEVWLGAGLLALIPFLVIIVVALWGLGSGLVA